jgi:hypothetical protein
VWGSEDSTFLADGGVPVLGVATVDTDERLVPDEAAAVAATPGRGRASRSPDARFASILQQFTACMSTGFPAGPQRIDVFV